LEYAVSGPPGKPAEEGEKNSEQVHAITRNYRFGPVFYFAAFLLAFVSVPASLGLCMALALFFGVTASRERVAEW